MDEKTRNEQALFRFSLIAPLVNGSSNQSIREYLEQVCSKRYDVPGSDERREFSPPTVKRWLTQYRRYGLDGLKPKARSDRGEFRNLNADERFFLTELLRANPKRTAVTLHQDLIASRLGANPSLSTVQRFVRTIKDELVEPELEHRRFELEFANGCWQADVAYGPHLMVDGKKRRTYLIAFLDDASRLIAHAEFYFEENLWALEDAFRKALLKHGIPSKLFVDNGKIFQSLHLRLICARMGTALSFSRVYTPCSKGKVERFFRTLRMQFLDLLEPATIESLAQLNRLTAEYIQKYNQRPHSALGDTTPLQRFLKDKERFTFISEEKLERLFLHEVERRVTKDATVSVNKKVFEVPQLFCGRRVTILFKPHDLTTAWLKGPDDQEPVLIQPVRPVDNARIPRKQNLREPLDFTALYGGDSDV